EERTTARCAPVWRRGWRGCLRWCSEDTPGQTNLPRQRFRSTDSSAARRRSMSSPRQPAGVRPAEAVVAENPSRDWPESWSALGSDPSPSTNDAASGCLASIEKTLRSVLRKDQSTDFGREDKIDSR